jgi:sporulation protein YlmC with PRC-barrel domain
MLAKYLMAGVAGSLLLASSAFAAEDTTAKTPAPATSASSTSASLQGDWRASKVVGLNVYNEQNENVGTINDLLMDKSGSIKAAVISVGGFLGMGARLIALPLDKVKFSEQPVPSTSASNTGAPGGAKPATTTGSATTASTTKSKTWYPDHATINGNKDELKKMPEFKYSE